jgi:hypothetical protein
MAEGELLGTKRLQKGSYLMTNTSGNGMEKTLHRLTVSHEERRERRKGEISYMEVLSH